MSSTGIVAWWGAVLSTIVFGWDVYKWRTAGPKLRFEVRTNQRSMNIPQYEGKPLIWAGVTNYGDRLTTITNLRYEYFQNVWCLIRRKPSKACIVVAPSTVQPLPFELKPGSVWRGIAIETPELKCWATEGFLYMLLDHSHTDKPIRKRVVFHAIPKFSAGPFLNLTGLQFEHPPKASRR